MSNVKSRVTRIKKKYPNHSPRFFYSRTAEEARITPITDHEKRNVEREIRNECVAVTRGVKVRRNCNVFNLAMDNVFKGLPDKIRDQLSRHHTQMHFKCTHF